VTAFVLLSPLAGALADRINRKFLMVAADVARVVVLFLLSFVTEVWQVYVLMFLLNSFTAFFTPTFQASIPLVTGKDEYARAISLSGTANEFFGMLGPGIAGSIAALIGGRSLFWLDGFTFLFSALLILTLRTSLQATEKTDSSFSLQDVTEGSKRLWQDAPMRYALLLELVAAISGAWILVNTVGFVKGQLNLGDVQYGWVMAAFGIGATLAALATGIFEKRLTRTTFLLIGATITSLAILPTNLLTLAPLMVLWFVAGAGQNWVTYPPKPSSQTARVKPFRGGCTGRILPGVICGGRLLIRSRVIWAVAILSVRFCMVDSSL
jgi:MFS transporter, NRE family, putaive nickel resistance protein